MPRVKLIYTGLDRWIAPKAKWGECEHPRSDLRFDPRFGLPTSMYCMVCGEAWIHPFHGLSDEQIAERRRQAKEWTKQMGWDQPASA